MTRPTPERLQEIRKGAKTWKWHANEINELFTELDALRAELDNLGSKPWVRLDEHREVLKERDRLRERKTGAYLERNKCVVLILRMALALGLKAGVAQHDPKDKEWEADWRTVVYIDLPSGQISWHFHDSNIDLLQGIPKYDGTWDGHSTELKYDRVLNPGNLERLREALECTKCGAPMVTIGKNGFWCEQCLIEVTYFFTLR